MQFEAASKLTEKAGEAGFIVVYPEGSGVIRTWNAGTCCGYAAREQVDDVKFISVLIDNLISKYKINPKQVYATGHSNGGMFCYKLACELSNKIAAVAPNAGTMVVTQACNPGRAVPILHMHSVNDEHIPHLGGTGNGISGVYAPAVDSVLNVWALKNNCPESQVTEVNAADYQIKTWAGCSGDAHIKYYLTRDGGHAWPGGLPGGPNSDIPSTSINANNVIWDFFSDYRLP